MITDKRLEQLKQKINVWNGSKFISPTKDFFKDSSNFPSGWCGVRFFNESTSKKWGWVNQNGEYLTGKTKFYNVGEFSNGYAWVRVGVGSKYTFIRLNGTDLYTGKIPTEETCKFNGCGDFSNGVALVIIGYSGYYINTLGFIFNADDQATASNMNKKFLKILNQDFPEHSMKRYLLEKFL